MGNQRTTTKNPMSISNTTLLSMILFVAHMVESQTKTRSETLRPKERMKRGATGPQVWKLALCGIFGWQLEGEGRVCKFAITWAAVKELQLR